MKLLVAGLCLALVAPQIASAAEYEIAPVDTATATVQYRNGSAGLQLVQGKSAAAIMILDGRVDAKERPKVVIGVENRGDQAFNFTPANVRVVTQTGEVLAIASRADMVSAAEKTARRKDGWARAGAMMRAAGAGQSSGSSMTTGTVQGFGGGGANFNAMTSGNSYNSADAAAETAQARADLDRAIARNQASVEAARRGGFAAQTVEPGTQYMTDLGLGPLPKDVTGLTITATVAGEVYTFPLSVVLVR